MTTKSELPPAQGPVPGELMPPEGGPPVPDGRSLAVASLALGVSSVAMLPFGLFCCSCFGGVLPILLGAGAAVCGHLSLSQAARAGNGSGRNMAIGGLITGYAGAGLAILLGLLFAVFMMIALALGSAGQAPPGWP
jgi:hypothetical protein